MKIFLDLEDTVIDNWHSGNPVNIPQVRFFLKLCDVKEVELFSFAVWHNSDIDEFDRRHRSMLEDLLEVKIVNIPSVNDMMFVDKDLTGIHFENITEFVSLRGKHGAFVNWCLVKEPGQHSVLIDDIVPNRVITDFDSKTRIESINVVNVHRGLHKGC